MGGTPGVGSVRGTESGGDGDHFVLRATQSRMSLERSMSLSREHDELIVATTMGKTTVTQVYRLDEALTKQVYGERP